MTSYEKCKKDTINKILKKFERNNKNKKSKQQRIAIALSISEKECKKKINEKDIKKMEDKVKKMIDKNKIQLTNINNSIYLLNYYKSKKKNSKVLRLENKIMKLLLVNFKNVSNNAVNTFNKYLKS